MDVSALMEKVLLEIRDDLRSLRRDVNDRIDQTNANVSVLAKIVQGIDRRLERMEKWQLDNSYLPRRVDVLEEKVEHIQDALDLE